MKEAGEGSQEGCKESKGQRCKTNAARTDDAAGSNDGTTAECAASDVSAATGTTADAAGSATAADYGTEQY